MYKPFNLAILFLIINFIETLLKVQMCTKIHNYVPYEIIYNNANAALFVIMKN